MKKNLQIIGAVIVLGLAVLFGDGFIPLKTSGYPLPVSKFTSWEDVFRHGGQFTLAAWETGRGLVASRASNLDADDARARAFPDSTEPIPMRAYYLNHPRWGSLLIDTGFDASFSGPRHGNYNPLARIVAGLKRTRHLQDSGQSLNAHLAAAPAQPSLVLFTHLHFDHTAGLPALTGREQVVVGKGQLDFASRALARHYLARFSRIRELDMSQGQPMPPFAKAADVLGDGSLWAIATPGHTPGHLSYVAVTQEGPVLITGDACMYHEALAREVAPFSQYAWDRREARERLRQIKAFTKAYPFVRVLVGHDDPELPAP